MKSQASLAVIALLIAVGSAGHAAAQSSPTSYSTNLLNSQPVYAQPNTGSNQSQQATPYATQQSLQLQQQQLQQQQAAAFLPHGYSTTSGTAAAAAEAAKSGLPTIGTKGATSGLTTADVKDVKFEGNARVVDGKTLQIGDKLFVLNGADSPAAGQTCTDKAGMAWECGRKAADRLFQLIDGRHVVCIGKDVARNGIAALCKVGTTDLGRTLVSEGLALAPQAVSKTYLPEEAAARSAQRGMWVGTFKTPWDFRAEN